MKLLLLLIVSVLIKQGQMNKYAEQNVQQSVEEISSLIVESRKDFLKTFPEMMNNFREQLEKFQTQLILTAMSTVKGSMETSEKWMSEVHGHLGDMQALMAEEGVNSYTCFKEISDSMTLLPMTFSDSLQSCINDELNLTKNNLEHNLKSLENIEARVVSIMDNQTNFVDCNSYECLKQQYLDFRMEVFQLQFLLNYDVGIMDEQLAKTTWRLQHCQTDNLKSTQNVVIEEIKERIFDCGNFRPEI